MVRFQFSSLHSFVIPVNILLFVNNSKQVNILEPGWEEMARYVCKNPSACPTGPCRRGGRAGRLSNIFKEEEMEEDYDEKEDNDVYDEEMEGKRRDAEDMTWSML